MTDSSGFITFFSYFGEMRVRTEQVKMQINQHEEKMRLKKERYLKVKLLIMLLKV